MRRVNIPEKAPKKAQKKISNKDSKSVPKRIKENVSTKAPKKPAKTVTKTSSTRLAHKVSKKAPKEIPVKLSKKLSKKVPMKAPDFEQFTDEDLVELCHQGDTLAEEYMLNRHKNLVRVKARTYYLVGADHEDIVQEGMIGLYKAIRDFRPEHQTSFRAFADLCVTRQMITAIKAATRQKNIPLNSYISLSKPVYEDESERTLLDVLTEAKETNPEDLMINRESLSNIHAKMNEILSGLECQVLDLYLDNKSYQEIAVELGRHVKSIDNALQRIKRKLEKYLEERQQSD